MSALLVVAKKIIDYLFPPEFIVRIGHADFAVQRWTGRTKRIWPDDMSKMAPSEELEEFLQ